MLFPFYFDVATYPHGTIVDIVYAVVDAVTYVYAFDAFTLRKMNDKTQRTLIIRPYSWRHRQRRGTVWYYGI